MHGDGVDQLLGRVDQGATAGTYWTLTDNLGSVRDVINNSGVVKDSVQYDSYGNIDVATETDATYRGNYAWTGRELDVETGLQYNRARYYDATTGRWISQDPLGFDAGDSNLYRYLNNAPLSSTDPSGRLSILQQANPRQTILFRANIPQVGVLDAVRFNGDPGTYLYLNAGKGFTLADGVQALRKANPEKWGNLDHFNFYQISSTTSPDGTVAERDYKSYNAQQVQYKFNTWYIDPGSGGQGDGKGKLDSWADNLPWYYDESLPPEGTKTVTAYSQDLQFISRQMISGGDDPKRTAIGTAQFLRFYDLPVIPAGLTITFKTWVVGVARNGALVLAFPTYYSWSVKATAVGADNTALTPEYFGFRQGLFFNNDAEWKDLIAGFNV